MTGPVMPTTARLRSKPLVDISGKYAQSIA